MTKYQFRWLIATYLFLAILSAFFDSVFTSLVPEAVRAIEQQYGTHQSLSELFGYALAGVGVLVILPATYGLFFFKKWAPRLALIATVLSVLSTSLIQFFAMSGATLALLDVAAYTWGAALIVCHIEPYRDWFRHGQSS